MGFALLFFFCCCRDSHGLGFQVDEVSQNKQEGNPSDIEPIFYVHIPKSGSSFATSIVHLACGGTLPKNYVSNDPGGGGTPYWRKKCGDGKFARFENAHAPLPDGIALRTVTVLFRPPRQRIISGFMHNLHDCRELQRKYHVDEHLPHEARWDPQARHDYLYILTNYSECVTACGANMLSGHTCGAGGRSKEDLQTAARTAVAKIPQLGFVGLTNHWELTVCMFHAKFGGECLAAEFANTNPTNKKSAAINETLFDSSFQTIDDAVYEAASKKFIEDMHKYDVNPRTCATTYCPNMAHLFDRNFQEADAANIIRSSDLDALWWDGQADYDQD